MKKARKLIDYSIFILIVLVLTLLVRSYAFQRAEVEGNSMEPTLSDGDSILVNKLAYKLGSPKRFEVVVFPFEGDTYFIKRIVGLPGETVEIREGVLLINGSLINDPMGGIPIEDAGIAAEPVVLKEDEYFLLGDNRNHSQDSRSNMVGAVHKGRLTGKAWLRIRPLEHFGAVK